MEHLSKQQIILLTLLVSFVTSIATGIVTVSLMDQAPVGVTQTINRVVEKTIERVVSDSGTVTSSNNATAVAAVDPVVQAVEKVSASLVRIRSAANKESLTGLGLVISNDGVIVTDKSVVAPLANPVAVFSDGQEFPIQIIQSQTNGDIAFVVALVPMDKKASVIKPITFSSSIKLGVTVMSFAGSFSGQNANALSQGIVEKVADDKINTSISADDVMIGSPLFNSLGEVAGLKTTTLAKENSFYSLNTLKSSIPVINSSSLPANLR